MEKGVRAIIENHVSRVTKPDAELLRAAFHPAAVNSVIGAFLAERTLRA